MKRLSRRITTLVLTLAIMCGMLIGSASAATSADQEKMAKALYSLNLFKGYDTTGTNFGLKDVPTREQALIFQIRELGEEKTALQWTGKSPFTDIPANNYSIPYIGYGVQKGYTNGMGGGVFGLGLAANAQMMATFVLRGMGYTDSGAAPDFTYPTSVEYIRKLGIISGTLPTVFTRGDAVEILYGALNTPCKDGVKLADKLIIANVFTKTQYEQAQRIVNTPTITGLPSTLVPLTTGNTTGNANNYGLAVTDGNYIYYSVLSSKRIDRMNMDGTSPLTLVNAHAQCLNIMDGWLYFGDNANQSICKIRLDGSGLTTIRAKAWPIYMQVTSDGWIYYVDNNNGDKLSRVKTDGTGYETVVNISTGDFLLFKDFVVLENEDDGSRPYWVSTRDFTQYGKISNLGTNAITYYNNRFYFADVNNGRRYSSMKTDGSDVRVLRQEFTGSAVIYKDKLYFGYNDATKTRDAAQLYVQTMATGATTKRLSGTYTAYSIAPVGNFVVYATKNSTTSTVRMVKLDGTDNKAAPSPIGTVTNGVPATGVSLNRTTASISEGKTVQLTATVSPSTATEKWVTWSSSATDIATVNFNGLVTGVKPGTATITATTSNGKKASCSITVTKSAVVTTTADFELYNNTKKTIKELYMSTTDKNDWGTNLLPTGTTIPNASAITLTIPFSKTTNYDILAKYSDGTEADFRGLSFATATQDGGAIVLEASTVTLYPQINVPVTFVNKTGKELTSVYASSKLVGDWGSNLGRIAKDGSMTIMFPITAYDTVFDFRTDYIGGKYEFSGMDFSKLPVNGATLYLYLGTDGKPVISETQPSVPEMKTREINIFNAINKNITSLAYKPSGSTDYLNITINGGTLGYGGQINQCKLNYYDNNQKLDFQIVIDGKAYEYTGFDLSTLRESYIDLKLDATGKFIVEEHIFP